ncbi:MULTISPECIES: LemA family protein [Alloalcanivorax]|jgi:LemA protein|uniref:LemA family protein n=2 Tax=Alloalcanivorax TaxID=3020832 RepID=A0A9Q3W4R6_9GAMM|nr:MULTISPECIES: LemA family protein [Alloalcanivorax]PHS66798.1 MAG: LemA family protein [Alcanivorax sp.]ARB44925.1 LemA [Alloalcanivorax xenomutans]MCE7508974.1 LemA family protein [Alloalcanivorax xenomutans]MCE7522249.1 LemA family protein [Alloalcanivorax xenomutans]MCU5781303.1 LemA family protein [Alloalcanivorax balearicus MACL04]
MGEWLFAGVIAALLLYLIAVYNRLIRLRNQYRNAFAQIDVQLQRRHDLIPNLVSATRAYLRHEQDTLTRVTEARRDAAKARTDAARQPGESDAMARLSQAENLLSGSLAQFRAVAESHPELRADATVSELMEALTSTENRIGFARQAFNDTVMGYNTYREQFPNNLIGGLFGPFRAADLLSLETATARQAVTVRL